MVVIAYLFLLLLGGGYTWWNAANPGKHAQVVMKLIRHIKHGQVSTHREISCFKCHGTALENGWHSLTEKTKMVFSHVKSAPFADDIRMTEDQILETMERCKSCHENEYANWLASGHSATYSDIFLDEKHNTTEQLNYDCVRCHGMFYEGTTDDLVEPISIEGPWKIKDKSRGKPGHNSMFNLSRNP